VFVQKKGTGLYVNDNNKTQEKPQLELEQPSASAISHLKERLEGTCKMEISGHGFFMRNEGILTLVILANPTASTQASQPEQRSLLKRKQT
jgi:hypothetical protein